MSAGKPGKNILTADGRMAEGVKRRSIFAACHCYHLLLLFHFFANYDCISPW